MKSGGDNWLEITTVKRRGNAELVKNKAAMQFACWLQLIPDPQQKVLLDHVQVTKKSNQGGNSRAKKNQTKARLGCRTDFILVPSVRNILRQRLFPRVARL